MRRGVNHFEQINACGVLRIAQVFELETRPPRGSSGGEFACPSCGARTRHTKSHDKRLAVGIRQDDLGWHCFQCEASGDGVKLIGLIINDSHDVTGTNGRLVLEACERKGLIDLGHDNSREHSQKFFYRPPPHLLESRKKIRIPSVELETFWEACGEVNATRVFPSDLQLEDTFYFMKRFKNPRLAAATKIVRFLPSPDEIEWPEWWPRSWANTWRIIMPAYSADGTFASVHARANTDEVTPKSRWPWGMGKYDTGSQLLFANAQGLAFLRGELCPTVQELHVVEGLTDTLRMAMLELKRQLNWAVLGMASGGSAAFGKIRWRKGLAVKIGTDDDTAGDRYAAEIRRNIPGYISVQRSKFIKNEGGQHE